MIAALPRGLARLALAVLAARLLASALLLPPWAGYDEPYHHGYVEAQAERLQWARVRAIGLPERLLSAIRQWPLPATYAKGFSARQYGQIDSAEAVPFRDTNHETQQSPLYFWTAGLLVRWLPLGGPTAELYFLRFVNAALAFSIGVLIGKVARSYAAAWAAIALLALMPGFGVSLARVANDALCAVLVSIALVGALLPTRGSSLAGSLAAGLSPWAKLYGLAAVPTSAFEALRGRRWTHLALVVLPPAALAAASLTLFGTPFAVMYNGRGVPFAPLSAVPWLRDGWAVVKSHVWMSGMSFLVFPTVLYAVPVVLLAGGLALTFTNVPAERRRYLAILSSVLGVFVVALAYHDWRTFAFYRGGGGTGGWYLFAVALPEMLLVADGAARRGWIRSAIVPALAVFLVLSVYADVLLFFDSLGRVLRDARGHAVGIAWASPPGDFLPAYLQTRPRLVAIAAVVAAVSSWILAGRLLWSAVSERSPRLEQSS